MTALSCIFLGAEGNFKLPGDINVTFSRASEPQNNYFGGAGYSTPLAWGLECRPLQIAALGYLHVFIHELGHALTAKAAGRGSISIRVCVSDCSGRSPSSCNTFGNLAGPLAGMTFRVGIIAMTVLLGGSIPAVAITLLRAGSIAWMTGEMFYMVAGSVGGSGDWQTIKGYGAASWTLSCSTMVAATVAAVALITL